MDTTDHKLTLKDFLADGGIKSRKLWLGIGCLILLAGFVGVAAHWASVAGLYSEFVAGVLGVYSIYVTGNAAGRWSTAKHIGAPLATGADPEASPEPKPRKPE